MNVTINLKIKGQEELEAALGEIEQEKDVNVNVNAEEASSSISDFANAAINNFARVGLAIDGVKKVISTIQGAIQPFVDASNIQEDAVTGLRAALRNTGLDAENLTGKMVAYAGSLQRVTRNGDEATLAGLALAQKIGEFAEDQLPRVTDAALGLAATYDMELRTAFELIGRAAKGQTQTLSRYGIVLDTTASKEAQFAELLEQGAAGLSIAKEQAESGAGALEQYENIVGDLQESIGDLLKKGLVPVAKKLGEAALNATEFFRELSESPLETTIRQLEDLGAATEDILDLKKFMWKQELVEVNSELKKAGVKFEDITDATKEVTNLNQERIKLIKVAAEYEKGNIKTVEDLRDKLIEIGVSQENINKVIATQSGYEQALRQIQAYQGGVLDLGQTIKTAISSTSGEILNQQTLLREHVDALIQREILEKKINQTIEDRDDGNDNNDIAGLPDADSIQKARAALDSFLLGLKSQREQLAAEYSEKMSIAEIAYAGNPEGLKAALNEIDNWYKAEQERIRQEEITAEKAAESEKLRAAKTRYEAAVKLAEARKNLGLSYLGDLETARSEYMQFLRESNLEESAEYLSLLAEKKNATIDFYGDIGNAGRYYIDLLGSAWQSFFGGILRLEVQTENRVIQGFINMANSFIAEVERMIAKWVTFQIIKGALAPQTTFLDFLGFAAGKFTGSGGKYEPAGIVHKNEWVLTQEATMPNLRELPILHSMLERGVSLRSILSGAMSKIPNVMPSSVPQFSFAAGGYGGNGELGGMIERLEAIEDAIQKVELKGEITIKDSTNPAKKHKIALQNKAAFERQVKVLD